MLFYFFLILLLAISVPVTFADKHENYSMEATVRILPICEDDEVIDPETFTCATPEPDPPTPPPKQTPPKSSGGASGSGGSAPTHRIDPLSGAIPKWIGTVVPWWNDNEINDSEFINMMTYLLDENIIPSDSVKPDIQIDQLSASTKQIFILWADNNLAESYVLRLIDYYRHAGVW